jgi:NTP pyrophosphatase (non-canonical NTP hydrolase)
MEREKILEELVRERKRQNMLHSTFPKDEFKRLGILLEEVGEVAKGLNDGNKENLKEELIQVASVCVRWLEILE